MAAINHSITEQELLDIKQALVAIERTRYDPIEADKQANALTYGVFRNLIDPASMLRWIIQQTQNKQFKD